MNFELFELFFVCLFFFVDFFVVVVSCFFFTHIIKYCKLTCLLV